MYNCACCCNSPKYCQLDTYGKLIDFSQVFTGIKNFRDECYCPPAVEDRYYDFMRPKIAANKFVRRTRSIERPSIVSRNSEASKITPRPATKSVRPDSDRSKAGCIAEHLHPDSVNLSQEYANIMDRSNKLRSLSFLSDRSKYSTKSQSKKVDISNIQSASRIQFNYRPEKNSQCNVGARPSKNNIDMMEKKNCCVPSECNENEDKCYCNWCRKPLEEDFNNLNKCGSENSQNKRTIGGSDIPPHSMYQKNSYVTTNASTVKFHKNQRNDSNNFSRMEVITEEPEENIQKNNDANCLGKLTAKNANRTESLQKIPQHSVDGKYAEIFIMMHDNILKSVKKSMEALLVQYCSKTFEQVDNLSKRIERNEYVLEKIYNELLVKIADQGDMYLQRFQYLLHCFSQNQNMKQRDDNNYNYDHNNLAYLHNQENNGNMQLNNSSHLHVNSGHNTHRFPRNFGGGSVERNVQSEQEYDKNIVKETPVEVFQKSFKYTNIAPTPQSSSSALKQSRAEMLARQLELNKMHSNNKPLNIKSNQSALKHSVNYMPTPVSSYEDNSSYNFHNRKWDCNRDNCCCEKRQDVEQDNRNIAREETNHEQLYYQRKHQHDLNIQKRSLPEYINKMYAKTHLEKSNLASNAFRTSRKKTGQTSADWQRAQNGDSNSELERLYTNHYNGDSYHRNGYPKERHSEPRGTSNLNPRFVYPTPQRVSYNFDE